MKDSMYFAPTEVEEAVKLLSEYGDQATILAGGTDLVPKINYYESRPSVLLYIGNLGIEGVKEENGKLVLGAMTTTSRLASDPLINEKAGALAEAARLTGSDAVRNSGTIGGNLANASPAADLVPPLLAMDAELVLTGVKGERTVAVKDFFTGPGKTVLGASEFIREIYFPVPKGRVVFLKLGRRKAMTLSVVNVAVRLHMDASGCHEARIAIGSMAPTAIRCSRAEKMLLGKKLDGKLIRACAEEAIADTRPIDDQRATAWYRRQAGKALVARAVAQAAGLDLQ